MDLFALFILLLIPRGGYAAPANSTVPKYHNANSSVQANVTGATNTTDDPCAQEKLTVNSTPTYKNEKVTLSLSNDEKVDMEYVCEPSPGTCTKLKHYIMYPLTPEENFYPSWTYQGFFPPQEWHLVPISYFNEPPLCQLDRLENYRIRLHGSAMHLCTPEVSSDLAMCRKKVKNECRSHLPSPLNIIRESTVEDGNLKDFTFLDHDVFFAFAMYIEPDGSPLLNVKLMAYSNDLDRRPGISGGTLLPGQKLFLDRILIRVGLDYRKGSEHSLDGEYFGMELQFFYTADKLPYWQILSRYKTMSPDDPRIGHQLQILSVFVKVAPSGHEPDDGSLFMRGDSMEILSLAAKLFWSTSNVNYFGMVRTVKKLLSLEEIFNVPEKGSYYSYLGSMSHPPCLTHAAWTIFEKPIWIPQNIWRRFAYVHSAYSDLRILAGNFRPQHHIMVRVELEMYHHMKWVEKHGEILQDELDEAMENWVDEQAPENSKEGVQRSNSNSGASVNGTGTDNGASAKNVSTTRNLFKLFIIRNYPDYQHYFSEKVRRKVKPYVGSIKGVDQYDYYEVEEDMGRNRSNNLILSACADTQYAYPMLIVVVTVLFIAGVK